MDVLLPAAYFPPISYLAYMLNNSVTIETQEHFVKQSIRSRCTILGANGILNLQVPRAKSKHRQSVSESEIHYQDEDWRKLHWRSLEAAYRNSPFFEFYANELKPFFEKEHTHHLNIAVESTQLIARLMNISIAFELSTSYQPSVEGLDLRNAWNKKDYRENPPVSEFPNYIQVFADRQRFVQDLSVLDLLFCQGPQSLDYLKNLKLNF